MLQNPIKFLTGSLEPSVCDYSNTYILVTGDIAIKRRNAGDTADTDLAVATQVAYKNCVPFKDIEQKSMILLLIM